LTRSRYTFERSERAIFIIDLGVGLSVTNDAERVIHDLVDRGIAVDRMVIVYRDTTGVWDQLLTKRGQFAGFRRLHANDRMDALRLAAMPRNNEGGAA
jgi:hypothetical protein